jgi:phosphoribosylanthranilate isomerase
MTKVKICGITNLEDALSAAKFGADALGFNFYRKSPRYIGPEDAAAIIKELPVGILKIGVFVNEDIENVIATASTCSLDAIQLHGDEPPDFVNELRRAANSEIIKAFRVFPGFDPRSVLKYDLDAVLLDAYSKAEYGGTGETFNWEIARQVREIVPKMYLAGGLSPENIAEAVRIVHPYAVDACSRLEQKPGLKHDIKVQAFINAAQGV